jgi:hypothetical protein
VKGSRVVDRLTNLTLVSLSDSKPIALNFGNKSPVFISDSIKTYAGGARFAPVASERIMVVKTYLSGQWLPRATVMIPAVVVRNSALRTERTVERSMVSSGSEFFAGGYYVFAFPVFANEDEAYFFADTKLLGKSIKWVNGPRQMNYVLPYGTVPTESSATSFDIPIVPTGKLKVTFSESPKK